MLISNLKIYLTVIIFLLGMCCTTFAGKIIYVDDDATGANNGTSWADAHRCLQDALAAAQYGDEIRVAQGIYKPDQGGGKTPRDRTASFYLINGVTLKGGYAGFGQLDPNARDINQYETILSGNLDSNDVGDVNDPSRNENSYHVIEIYWIDETAVLDGFTISGGNANAYPYDGGGGMMCCNSSPIVVNCTFSGNRAEYGGGGAQFGVGTATLANCMFRNNSAVLGAGMYNVSSRQTLINCTFSGNSASNGGGGMHNYFSNPMLTNCIFIRNSTGFDCGGGMHNYAKLSVKSF